MISFVQKKDVPASAKTDSLMRISGNCPAGITGIIYFYLLGFIACLLVICVSLPGCSGKLTSKGVGNVHYVDSKDSNFLFRGASPLNEKFPLKFDYDDLTQAMKNATPPGMRFPEKFFLIDINLLQSENSGDGTNPGDIDRIVAEYLFFKNNPSLGAIYVWGMRGTGIKATDPALAGSRDYLARHLDDWLNDELVKRVQSLRDWLETGAIGYSTPKKTNEPVVIYMHCYGGCDRTGELSGAYYLRYLHKSWQEVNDINREMCGRPFGCNNYRAVQWYCCWLSLPEQGFKLNWWEDYGCTGLDRNPCK